MSKILLILLVVPFFLVACTKNNLDKANGEWDCNVRKSLELGEEIAQHHLEHTLHTYTLQIDTVAEKFFFNGVISLQGPFTKGGTYTAVSDKQNVLTLRTKDFEAHITFVDNDNIIVWFDFFDFGEWLAFSRKK